MKQALVSFVGSFVLVAMSTGCSGAPDDDAGSVVSGNEDELSVSAPTAPKSCLAISQVSLPGGGDNTIKVTNQCAPRALSKMKLCFVNTDGAQKCNDSSGSTEILGLMGTYKFCQSPSLHEQMGCGKVLIPSFMGPKTQWLTLSYNGLLIQKRDVTAIVAAAQK